MTTKRITLICGLIGSICNFSEATKYNAFVLTKHSNNKDWQILLEQGKTTGIFRGFNGSAPDDDNLIDEAKKLITQNIADAYTEKDLHLVFEKRDPKNSRATLIFYSELYFEGNSQKNSWMKITSIKGKNEVYYGKINSANGRRSRIGSLEQGLYTYLTTSQALATAVSNAENNTYLDTKKPIVSSKTNSKKGSHTSAQELPPLTCSLTTWPQKGTAGSTHFYTAGEPFYELSNTYQFNFTVPDKAYQPSAQANNVQPSNEPYVIWKSSEHFFQASKYKDPSLAYAYFITLDWRTGQLQKNLGKKSTVKNQVKAEEKYSGNEWSSLWDAQDRFTAMLTALRAKFTEPGVEGNRKDAERIRRLLLDTGNDIIVEDTAQDKGNYQDPIWGAGGPKSATPQGILIGAYKGFNYLGQLLMHVRNEIRSRQAFIFIPANGPQFYKGVSTTPDPNAPQWYLDRLAQIDIQNKNLLKIHGKTPQDSLETLQQLAQALKTLLPL